MTQTGPTVVVTGLTAARMLEIENESVTGGLVNANGELILSTRGGTEIDAGVVKGPQGDPGAQGIQGEQGIQGPKGDNSMPAGSITLWASDVAPANWLICDGSAVSRVTYASLFAAIGTKYGVGDGTTTFNLPNLNGKAPVGKDDAQTEFNALGKTGGEKTHILTATEMPSHTHVQNSHNHVVISDVVAASGHTHGLSTAYADVLLAAVSSNQLALRRFTTPTWTPTHSYTLGSVGAGAYSTPSTVGTQLGGNTDPPDTTSRVGLSATTGTNQNTGGDGAHNNLQPYSVVNFIIKTSNGDTEGDSQLTQRVNSLEVDRTPAGSVNVFSGAAAPLGWLLCDGSAVSRTTYAKLFAVIGTTYGAGDGSTTFAVPNLKGKVVVGVDGAQAEFNTLGETGGEKTHKLTAAEMPSHTHTQNAHNHNQDPHNHIQDPHNHFANTASPGATGTRYADSANGMAHTIYGAMATPTNQETTATNSHYRDEQQHRWRRRAQQSAAIFGDELHHQDLKGTQPMAGRDVSRTELDLRASDAVVAVREAFELVTTVHEFLNLQHADAAGGDPLTVPTTNEDGTPAAGKFGYTADEAYLLRLVFDQLSSLAVQPILETGRQLTGLK